MSSPLPIILCGKSPDVGRIVVAGLKPEYEVVNFITNLPAAPTIISSLLQGNPPPEDDNNVGTRNYSHPPLAVIMPAKYSDHESKVLAQTAYHMMPHHGFKRVPWLRPDESRPFPEWGTEEYWQVVFERVKVCLGGLRLGREDEVMRGFVYY